MIESNRDREWKKLLTLSVIAFLLLAPSFPVARAAPSPLSVPTPEGATIPVEIEPARSVSRCR